MLRTSERIHDEAAGAALWRMTGPQAGAGWCATLSAVQWCGGEREVTGNIDFVFQSCGMNFKIKYRNK